MKVILKGGSFEKNREIEKFFMENIFPILEFGIAIEESESIIIVHEKKTDATVERYVDPTAEVIVELTEEARNLAKDGNTDQEEMKRRSGKFYDEALAIMEIERLQPSFSVEYYSCRYKPPQNKT